MAKNIIKAVAGILYQNKMVLMAGRPRGKIYAGYWEFAGGKLEATESAAQALVRELKEEINVMVLAEDCQYFTSIEQEYEHGLVQLDVMLIKNWVGEVIPLEQQELYWQDITKPCILEPLLITTQKILDKLVTNYAN